MHIYECEITSVLFFKQILSYELFTYHLLIHWVATHDPWTLSTTLEWSFQRRSRGENDWRVDDLRWCKMLPHELVWVSVVWNMNFIFPKSWDDDPIWLIFFRGVGIPPIRKCWDGLPIWKSNRLASDFEEPLFFRILSWNGESEDLIQRSCDLAWFDYPRMDGDSEFLQISIGWFIQLRNIHSNYPIIPDNSAWLGTG